MKKVYSGIQSAIYNKTYDIEEAIALRMGKIYIRDEYVLINKPIELTRDIYFENCVVILGESGRVLMNDCKMRFTFCDIISFNKHCFFYSDRFFVDIFNSNILSLDTFIQNPNVILNIYDSKIFILSDNEHMINRLFLYNTQVFIHVCHNQYRVTEPKLAKKFKKRDCLFSFVELNWQYIFNMFNQDRKILVLKNSHLMGYLEIWCNEHFTNQLLQQVR